MESNNSENGSSTNLPSEQYELPHSFHYPLTSKYMIMNFKFYLTMSLKNHYSEHYN